MTFTDMNGKEIKDGDLLKFRSGYIGQLIFSNGDWFLKLPKENSPKISATIATVGTNRFSSARIIKEG